MTEELFIDRVVTNIDEVNGIFFGKPEEDPAAVALGRLGGLKGGKARAAKLSAKKRSKSRSISFDPGEKGCFIRFCKRRGKGKYAE